MGLTKLRSSLDHRQHRIRTAIEQQRPSVPRVLVTLLSYTLLLSDTLRAAVAVRSLVPFKRFDADAVTMFGPSALAHVQLARVNLTQTAPIPIWPYKFDSKSTGLRALAEHLRVPTWSPCVLYRGGACQGDQAVLAAPLVFEMIDSLIDSVKSHKSPSAWPHKRITLRIKHQWMDRLNHRVLPWAFGRFVHRAIQATVYDLKQDRHRQLCGRELPAPIACQYLWIPRKCTASVSPQGVCRGAAHALNIVLRRMNELQERDRTATVEALVVEGVDDYTRGAFLVQGLQRRDVVVFLRLRQCSSNGTCSTVAVEDYRYQDRLLRTNVTDFAVVITALRVIGQLYMYARFLGLLLGCFVASKPLLLPQHRSAYWRRAAMSIKLLFLVPSQVVVYGSLLPVACYATAHVMDAVMMQQFMDGKLSTLGGVLNQSVTEMLTLGATAMRSVWLLAFVCHLASMLWSSRSWSPVSGVIGMPEFFITALASVTIVAQLRAISWRDSRVLETYEVPSSSTNTLVRALRANRGLTMIDHLLVGTAIDAQFITVAAAVYGALTALTTLTRHVVPRCVRSNLFVRTPVMYSAGALWRTNMLVVSWFGSIVVTSDNAGPRAPRRKPSLRPDRWAAAVSQRIRVLVQSQSKVMVVPPLVELHSRSPDDEALIFLMNLTMMTDPMVFLRLRLRDGVSLIVVRSMADDRHFLLPSALAVTEVDVPLRWDELEIVAELRSTGLAWWQLLQSG
ncbi:hypothetical protein P43SY_011944 [Pythium insidiosum]|uniref:Transmembrane protein n=1 Tax=Pythium insidiosum TaxID=114742 RepID=A0AAD5LTI0_PYTIN|nr:hypothetical protein P43SY_011944 [Pythium insidiosum]